jgi:signal transduction histidine kinase
VTGNSDWPLEATPEDDLPLPPPWDGEVDIEDGQTEWSLVFLQFSEPELAIRICRHLFCRAEAAGDEKTALHALHIACCNLYNRSQHELADRVFETVRDRSAKVTDPRLSAQIKLFHAIRLNEKGEFAQAMLLRQNALGTAMALGDNGLIIYALSALAQSAMCIDDGELALALLEQQGPLLPKEGVRALTSRSHREVIMANAWQLIAASKRSAGDDDAARTALQRARDLAQSACTTALNDREALYALETSVHMLLLSGCAEAARAQVARTSALLETAPSVGTASWCVLRLALARIDIHEGALAEQTLQTLKTIEGLQDKGSELDLLSSEVQDLMLDLHQRFGQHEQALACHKRSTGWHAPSHSAELRQRVKLLRHTVLAMRAEAVEFITHDLLTPLAAAQTWLQALGREHLEPARLPSLRNAHRLLDHTRALSDQYLGLLRAELLPRGLLPVIDLGALADDICESAMPPHSKALRLSRTIDIGTPVLGDATLLGKALAALLADAFSRAPPCTAVELRLAHDTMRGQAVLSISHMGTGPSASARTRLHQQSFDGNVFAADALGLALAAKVCRLHRMRLRFDAAAPHGSRLRLTVKTAPQSTTTFAGTARTALRESVS